MDSAEVGKRGIGRGSDYSRGSLVNLYPSFAADTWAHSQYVPRSLSMRYAVGTCRQESDQFVRQSTARKGIPRVLTPKESKALLKELAEPCKAMVLVAGCLGLRAGELIGLQ